MEVHRKIWEALCIQEITLIETSWGNIVWHSKTNRRMSVVQVDQQKDWEKWCHLQLDSTDKKRSPWLMHTETLPCNEIKCQVVWIHSEASSPHSNHPVCALQVYTNVIWCRLAVHESTLYKDGHYMQQVVDQVVFLWLSICTHPYGKFASMWQPPTIPTMLSLVHWMAGMHMVMSSVEL